MSNKPKDFELKRRNRSEWKEVWDEFEKEQYGDPAQRQLIRELQEQHLPKDKGLR